MIEEKHCDVFSETSLCYDKNITVFFLSVIRKSRFHVKKYNIPFFLRFS